MVEKRVVTLLGSDTRPRGREGMQYRRAWSFKGETEAKIREVLKDAPRPIVHACCGASRLGVEDVRVDLHHPSADIKADVCELEKHTPGAGTVVMDPPWGIGLALRQKMVNGAMRALRPGGRLVLYAPWLPKWRKVADLVDLWFRIDGNFGFPAAPVMLAVYVKRHGRKARKDRPGNQAVGGSIREDAPPSCRIHFRRGPILGMGRLHSAAGTTG